MPRQAKISIPHPVPETVSDRKSRFLFFILAWGRRSKTLEGEPWFVAADVCRALGYVRPADALAQHCKGSVKRRLLTMGGEQDVKFIPEGDVYRLITHSKLPAAEKFESWVFDEVIPSIRKTGGYIAGQETIIPTSSLMAKAMPLIQPRAMKLNSHLLMQWPSV